MPREMDCRECGAAIGRRVYDDGQRVLCRTCAHSIVPELAARADAEYDRLNIHEGTAVERLAASMYGRPTPKVSPGLAAIVGALANDLARRH